MIGRNVNQELTKFYPKNLTLSSRRKLWQDTRNRAVKEKWNNAYFRCPECQKLLPGDNSILQKHMIDEHVRDRAKNKMKAWKFTPDRFGRNERVI